MIIIGAGNLELSANLYHTDFLVTHICIVTLDMASRPPLWGIEDLFGHFYKTFCYSLALPRMGNCKSLSFGNILSHLNFRRR